MQRRMTSSRLSTARRPTESSKALSASKDKSLSAVSLTKRTVRCVSKPRLRPADGSSNHTKKQNSLVFDVEEIKTNLRDLQVQGQEVVQQEQFIQELSAKVGALQQAFESLSDVCIYVDETQKRLVTSVDSLLQRVASLEKSVSSLQSQAPKAEARRKQYQDSSERRFSDFQEAFAKLALSVYETQAELGRVKNSAEHLLTREHEATNLAQSLQHTQEQASEWLNKLKNESAQLSTELFALKEQTGVTSMSLASDVQVLAKECSSVRSAMTQQHAQWLQKLETLREAIDRQSKIEKTQLTQRLDALGETVTTQELRTRDSLNTLLKNHARIREAMDESMAICSSEIKILSQEWKATQEDHRGKLEDLVQQLAQQSLDANQKYESLRCSVRSMAIQLDVEV